MAQYARDLLERLAREIGLLGGDCGCPDLNCLPRRAKRLAMEANAYLQASALPGGLEEGKVPASLPESPNGE